MVVRSSSLAFLIRASVRRSLNVLAGFLAEDGAEMRGAEADLRGDVVERQIGVRKVMLDVVFGLTDYARVLLNDALITEDQRPDEDVAHLIAKLVGVSMSARMLSMWLSPGMIW